MSFNGELRGITKSFGDVHANQGVDVTIRAGTIHALIGENGAGKSTAMKILFGMVKPDQGSIKFGNTVVCPNAAAWNPQEAIRRGIGMVHQHFMLAGPETVLDNLTLGVERTRFGFRDRQSEATTITELMRTTGLEVPLDAQAESLPVGLQSRCEILKVLYRKARFLILDEPTAVLTPQEIEDFLKTLKTLRAKGNTILLVTHKLKEIMSAADEATVLRAGRTVATRKITETSIAELSELMVGRKLQMPKATRTAQSGLTRLKIATPNFELSLRAGEITGIAGVEGNGQEELIEAVAALKTQLAIIPADRHKEGLLLPFSLSENLRLSRKFAQVKNRKYFGGPTHKERERLREYDVRPPKPELAAAALSGGNQQKLIVARELADLPDDGVVLAVHPTRGVDLGAIEFIHGKLLAAAQKGSAILLLSSELEELMSLSHRIGVLYRGNLVQWFEGPSYAEQSIGYAMLSGGGQQGAPS